MTTPCPHASLAMIAAGIPTCGTCEDTPPAGFLDDDTTRQEAALEAAYEQLATAFDAAAQAATVQAKMCRRKRPRVDWDTWRAHVRTLDMLEQDVDTATADLATAKGAHL